MCCERGNARGEFLFLDDDAAYQSLRLAWWVIMIFSVLTVEISYIWDAGPLVARRH